MPRPPRSNPKTRTRAIELRKELTPAERKLWANLRGDKLGVNFRRHCPKRHQAVIRAIGDTSRRTRHRKLYPRFCLYREETHHRTGRHSLRSQHLEQEEYDDERTKSFESIGYKVIPQGDNVRYWNNDVMKNIDGVIRAIIFALDRA